MATTITPLEHLHGHFYHCDLHTDDVDAAGSFYRQLFGWSLAEIDGAPNRYVTASLEDRGKAAITGLVAGADATRPYWFPYLWVDDLDAALERIEQLGGTVVASATQVFDIGRMAAAQDPTGAHFGLWQDLQPATTVQDEHGSPFWYELHSADIDRALEFYGELLGWRPEANEVGPDLTYFTLASPRATEGQEHAGGAIQLMQSELDAGLPSYWAVYFHVDDVDAAYARALELGGSSVMEPHDIPQAGRSCWIADPQGAVFAAMTPAPRV